MSVLDRWAINFLLLSSSSTLRRLSFSTRSLRRRAIIAPARRSERDDALNHPNLTSPLAARLRRRHDLQWLGPFLGGGDPRNIQLAARLSF
ncbi:MAG: hypothetical protein H0T60_02780 [Acidobacteria bacterium]|nr:hypothetical protein [Acidobacteriota bacterium]